MQHADILALAGLRTDGRVADEPRQLKCKLGLHSKSEGSVYLAHGLNKVLVTVIGPIEAHHRDSASQDKGSITCQISVASFAGSERKKKKSNSDRRTQEMQNFISSIFSEVVMLELYARSEIRINIHVFEDDGSLLSTMINGASMALMDAGISMLDIVVSCSSGIVRQMPCLDLNRVEQFSGGVYLPFAICSKSEKVLFAAMDSKISIHQFEKLCELSIAGCKKIAEFIEAEMRENVKNQIQSGV